MIPDRPTEPGKKKAMLFTLAVHLLLIGGLFLGVQWKRSEPEAMQVELWSPTPVKATRVAPPVEPPKPVEAPPKPPEPVPVPVKVEVPKKPDIVVKEEKKAPEPKKPEPPKPEPKKPEPVKPEPKPAPKVDPFKEMLERETRERQAVAEQNLQAALAEKEQRAAANRRGLESYASKIRIAIRNKIVLPPSIQGNPEAIFEVNQLPGGDVLSIRMKRSSGVPALDAAIERAIRSASPLPKPDDPALFQRVLEIKYKPFEE